MRKSKIKSLSEKHTQYCSIILKEKKKVGVIFFFSQ